MGISTFFFKNSNIYDKYKNSLGTPFIDESSNFCFTPYNRLGTKIIKLYFYFNTVNPAQCRDTDKYIISIYSGIKFTVFYRFLANIKKIKTYYVYLSEDRYYNNRYCPYECGDYPAFQKIIWKKINEDAFISTIMIKYNVSVSKLLKKINI